eukprot:5154069-Prymnesium_polylepis.2
MQSPSPAVQAPRIPSALLALQSCSELSSGRMADTLMPRRPGMKRSEAWAEAGAQITTVQISVHSSASTEEFEF